jgi:ribonuclease VapC
MVIDTSAIMAIYLTEPDDSIYVAAILADATRLMSASTFFELSSAALRKRLPDPLTAIDAIMNRFRVITVPFDREQALIARDAYRRYGKGVDPLGLNLGDCFSYALSKQLNEPLLFKGNDFRRTDVVSALKRTTEH